MNKGMEMVLVKILTVYTSLDLSNNHFHGETPSTIGDLQSLVVVNLSSNSFEGLIPSSLQKLRPIPVGGQFSTFPNSSFEGNVELCGVPLSKKCEISEIATPHDHSQESESEIGFGWEVVLIGNGCGFVIGVIAGYVVITRRPNFYAKIYGRRLQW
ncbi:LRR domain containing protein [Trema orientale]|uniref:LRR domain containing protein n=1 Tax=Trema orientale TaxID=63057 RepID=A0A2P5EJG8_TREOI|nr:LRR domain containing protein [Trema orientale]